MLAAAIALTLAAGASAAPMRTSGTLRLNATLTSIHLANPDYCPPGSSGIVTCVRYVGEGEIPGLGRATSTYTKTVPDDANCPIILHNSVVIEVAGKGTLELSRPGMVCGSLNLPVTFGPLEFTVTGASGMYAGASGSLTFKSVVDFVDSTDTWAGMLTVPGVDFDITPPIFTGAASKTVRAPRGAKRMRVRYTVAAQDAVDGSVAVACTPRSGSWFKRGRTKVSCLAIDSSGNTGRATFTVVVR